VGRCPQVLPLPEGKKNSSCGSRITSQRYRAKRKEPTPLDLSLTWLLALLTAASVLVLGASAKTQALPPGDLTLDTKAFGNPNNLSERFPSATVGEPFYYEVTINKPVNTSTVDAVFLDTLPLNVIVTDLRGQTECRAESKNIIICNFDDLGQPNVVGKILVFEVCAKRARDRNKDSYRRQCQRSRCH
jgi:hypothetical protein